MAASPWVMDVTETTFEEAVVRRSTQLPVVLDFWAPWCGPCRMLDPLLEKLADEYAGKFVLGKIDIDQHPALAQEFGVSSIPFVAAIVEGKVLGHFLGVQPEPAVRNFLHRICPTEAQTKLKQAVEILPRDPTAAQKLVAEAVALEPNNTIGQALLADLELQAGRIELAKAHLAKVGEGTDGWEHANKVRDRLELLELAGQAGAVDQCRRRVADAPHDLAARRDLAIALAAEGKFDEALALLLAIVEQDRTFGQTQVKDVMVKIFNLLGQQHELTVRYRGRLANALY